MAFAMGKLFLTCLIIGYTLSISLKKDYVSLAGTVMAIAWSVLFSGLFPSLQQVKQDIPAITFLWDISGPRWAIEAFWISEIKSRDLDLKQVPVRPFYSYDDFTKACLFMLAITAAWILVALLVLKFSNRQKQK